MRRPLAYAERVYERSVELEDLVLFADMVLLLILFLCAIAVVQGTVRQPVDLPRMDAPVSLSPATANGGALVTVRVGGRASLRGHPVGPALLEAYLERAANRSLEPRLYVRAERGVQYRDLRPLLRQARRHGLERIVFVVESVH